MCRLIGNSKRRTVSNTGQEISLNDFKSLPTIRFLYVEAKQILRYFHTHLRTGARLLGVHTQQVKRADG